MLKIVVSLFLFFTGSLSYANPNPVKILVGQPPGGAQDILGRIFEESFERQGIKSIVFNKPGASGIVAFNECEKDSQYLCVVGNGQLVSSVLQPESIRKFSYDNINYVKVVAVSPVVLITNSKNTKSIKEVFEDIKENKVNFGSGVSGLHHDTLKLFKVLNAKNAQSIEYTGNPQVIVDIVGNHLNYSVMPYPLVRNNQDIRIVATMKKNQFSVFKDIPSIESFYPTLNADDAIYGFVTSSKTSPSIKDFYINIITTAMKDPELKQKFLQQGLFFMDINLTDQDYKRLSDTERLQKMKSNNIQ
jgi:tripartite-type tricarboxylate transporter receptor subunit TctC